MDKKAVHRINDRVLQVRISDDLKKQFDKIIKDKSINKSDLLRNLIIKWIEDNK